MATQSMQYSGFSQTAAHNNVHERLANGLGWFSIGLGLAEVMAPGKVAQLIGLRNEERSRSVLRFYGVREIAAGVGILSRARPAGWLWGRVAGDALDLTSLGSALKANNADRTKLLAATAAVAGVTAADVICARGLSRSDINGATTDRSVRLTKTIIVNRSPEEVYRFWRNFENLPTFMNHLESVKVTDDGKSHWKLSRAAGKRLEWDAEMIEDQPNSRISWRSLPGSDVDNSGSVTFERATGGRGTLVRVEMRYAPPLGAATASKIAKLFGKEPGQQIERDLYAFKQVMETGEVVKSDASIHTGMHAARPSKD